MSVCEIIGRYILMHMILLKRADGVHQLMTSILLVSSMMYDVLIFGEITDFWDNYIFVFWVLSIN